MSTAEMEVFVPYSRRAPDTDDVNELRAQHLRMRELHGRRSSEAAESFEHLFRASCAKGHPLDALNVHSRNEVERFFAQTVPGSDGHVYWNGAKHGFTRNDGKSRSARRWWWAHRAGTEPPRELDIVPMCGEKHCITPEHCESGRDIRRRRFSDEQMLGGLQVTAMRLGHSPSTIEWRKMGLQPSDSVFKARFGTWGAAITSAGLPPVVPQYFGLPKTSTTPEACEEALHRVAKLLGRAPATSDFDGDPRVKAMLREAGLPLTPEVIGKYLGDGSWKVALIRHGYKPMTGGRVAPGTEFTPETCMASLRLVAGLKGRLPFISDFSEPEVREALRAQLLPISAEAIQRHLSAPRWRDAVAKAGLAVDA